MNKTALHAVAVVVSGVLAWTTFHAAAAWLCLQRSEAACATDGPLYAYGIAACIAANVVLGIAGARPLVWGYGTLAGVAAGGVLAGIVRTDPSGPETAVLVVGGAAVVLAPVILVGTLALLGSPLRLAERRKRQRLVSRGVPGTATLMSVTESKKTLLEGRVQVWMRLRIEPPAGAGEPFEQIVPGLVASEEMPTVGASFAVVVDPEQPREWAFAEGTPDLGTSRGLRNPG
ncbi:MAG TPA: hypothetical protein VNA14_04025 [Mycobacteriales bacterium]|nr:hypothetical protein [Mycobacteriales bacterium]